jgi:hypothetical protein
MSPPKTLRRGDYGENVRVVQRILNKAFGLTLDADGDFGRATETAVRFFQWLTGCTVDGIIGPETWGMLERVSNGGKPWLARFRELEPFRPPGKGSFDLTQAAAEKLEREFLRAEKAEAVGILRATRPDLSSVDLITCCHLVVGDLHSAQSGVEAWKRWCGSAEAALSALANDEDLTVCPTCGGRGADEVGRTCPTCKGQRVVDRPEQVQVVIKNMVSDPYKEPTEPCDDEGCDLYGVGHLHPRNHPSLNPHLQSMLAEDTASTGLHVEVLDGDRPRAELTTCSTCGFQYVEPEQEVVCPMCGWKKTNTCFREGSEVLHKLGEVLGVCGGTDLYEALPVLVKELKERTGHGPGVATADPSFRLALCSTHCTDTWVRSRCVVCELEARPRCTCDEIGDGPCPVHERENHLQDERNEALERVGTLRAAGEQLREDNARLIERVKELQIMLRSTLIELDGGK